MFQAVRRKSISDYKNAISREEIAGASHHHQREQGAQREGGEGSQRSQT